MNALLRWLEPILNPMACLPSLPTAEKMENADALLQRLDALLRQKLKYGATGERRGVLKGQGLDFADLREYTPGDDIRKMDWSVFARTLTPHVREYHEEKQLTLWLAIDLTASMRFGRRTAKLKQAIELAGLFSLLAEKSGHKLGAYLIESNQPAIIPPGNSREHMRHLMQRLLASAQKPPDKLLDSQPLSKAFQQLNHVVAKQSTVILLSDFLESSSWQAALGQLSHKARLLSLLLMDPSERDLPAHLGILTLQDPETGHLMPLDTKQVTTLRQYEQATTELHGHTLGLLRTLGPTAMASTEKDALDIVVGLLQNRPGATQ